MIKKIKKLILNDIFSVKVRYKAPKFKYCYYKYNKIIIFINIKKNALKNNIFVVLKELSFKIAVIMR